MHEVLREFAVWLACFVAASAVYLLLMQQIAVRVRSNRKRKSDEEADRLSSAV